MLNLGVRLHDLGKGSPDEMAAKAAGKGFSCVQLALQKAIAGFEFLPGRLSAGFAKSVRDSFAKHGVGIAVLGCYINPIHPDPSARKLQTDVFKEHLAFARDFGCSLVATETGSINPNCSYNPETDKEEHFMDLVETVADLADTAEHFGVFVGIEGVSPTHAINTHKKMARLIEMVDSPNLRVLYDPVNFLPHDRPQAQEENMDEAFRLFADRFCAIHLKDFVIENGIKKAGLPAGDGIFNFKHFFGLLKKHKPSIECLVENGTPETMERIAAHLKTAFAAAEG